MTRTIWLRPWQRLALDRFGAHGEDDFLAVATPGAGKTTFALAAARQALGQGAARLIVVVPTAHLKRQWSKAASAFDLHLEDRWSPKNRAPLDMHGIVTTYQHVATCARALARLAREAFVVLDEVHHAGDERTWGAAAAVAFAPARRRLLLSGTPFRSDALAIPFVRYVDGEAQPDFEYGYGEALADGRVVRPIYFPRTNGHMEWSAPDGTVHAATFDDPLATEQANQRLRTALSLEGEWLPEVLAAANARLASLRARHLDAGGLVIATDQDHARGIAKLLKERFSTNPVVATSDDPDASETIARFAASSAPWLVAVRMVSEGVDIPRLRVGVYATATTTELFFRQAVGRLVRFVPGLGRQAAYLYIPDDARLRKAADAIAEVRRHRVGTSASRSEAASAPQPGTMEQAEASARQDGQLSLFSVISAVATEAFVPEEPDEHDAALDADKDPSLLLELGTPPPLPARAAVGISASSVSEVHAGETRAERKGRLRLENAALARSIARATGLSHAKVNAELNRLAGISKVTEATLGQLEARLAHGRRWLARC
jgi:superfamily II DNA or RNA helicase